MSLFHYTDPVRPLPPPPPLLAQVLALFDGGAVGYLYRAGDFSHLFQSSDGTTPVTAAGQPVGLLVDHTPSPLNASQATSSHRPTVQINGAGFRIVPDKVDDKLVVSIPAIAVGTRVTGAPLGTIATGFSSPAQDVQVVGNQGSPTDYWDSALVAELLIDRALTEEEIELVGKWMEEEEGAGPRGAAAFTGRTSLSSAYWYADLMTSYPVVNTASVTDFEYAWARTHTLTTMQPLDMRNGTTFAKAWQYSGIQTMPLMQVRNATTFAVAWMGCASLVDFPPHFFDNWIGTPANLCLHGTWSGCVSLSAQSVENILVSINASGRSAPSGSGGSDKNLTVDYNASSGALSSAAEAAIVSLKAKNWVVRINGVIK